VVRLADNRYFLYRPDNSGELEESDQLVLTGDSMLVRSHDASFYVQHLVSMPQGILSRQTRDVRSNTQASWSIGLKGQFCAYRVWTVSIPAGADKDTQVLLSDFSPDTQLVTMSQVLEQMVPFDIHKGHPFVRAWRISDFSRLTVLR